MKSKLERENGGFVSNLVSKISLPLLRVGVDGFRLRAPGSLGSFWDPGNLGEFGDSRVLTLGIAPERESRVKKGCRSILCLVFEAGGLLSSS